MPAKTIAQEDVSTADEDASLRDVASTMADDEVGSVVVTRDGEPAGIVSDRDIALAVGRGEDDSLTAGDLADGDVATIEADREAVEVSRKMGEAKVRRLPVVDEDGSLVGIVSLDDVVATVGEELEDVATVIESQSPGYSPD